MKAATAISISAIKNAWEQLASLVQARISANLSDENGASILVIPPIPEEHSFLRKFVQDHNLGNLEYWTLLMALAPHVRPQFWDAVIQKALPQAGDYSQIGGLRGKQFRGFLPTGETVLFVLAGDHWDARQKILELFDPEHPFAQKKILWLEAPPEGEPLMSGKLVLNPVHIALLNTGKEHLPHFSSQFPAQLLKTKMDWSDLVLNPQTRGHIDELRAWLNFNPTLLDKMGLSRKLKPGYRALFYGPPGTGKTLTATLLGQEFKKDVFRVDLSMVVSKYIGETEKNLARLFDQAEHRNWILFFDEADALFGKRTQVKDAHDRYANQEVSYLMQRIETFEGLVILASNLKGNMDDAFTRRFQSIIFFPYPSPEEQLAIWGKAFPETLPPTPDTDLPNLAQRYKLSGSNIMNIVQYCCLEALSRRLTAVPGELILKGIHRELMKEGRAS